MVHPGLLQMHEIINLFHRSEPDNITVNILEGKTLNITCRARMEPKSSFLLWPKDKRPIKKGRKRSQAGDYMCVSLSQDGNHSSPFTAFDVLCEYLQDVSSFKRNRPFHRTSQSFPHAPLKESGLFYAKLSHQALPEQLKPES